MPDISCFFSRYTHLHLGLTRVGVMSLVFAEEQKEMEEEDPFTFDYHRLRVGGLILAAVLCLIGITILFSGHCRCKFNQDKRRRSGSNAAQPLNDQARASEC
uniref:FXYD domain-containing ion transport regulator n=1 Tax=Hucho hucho TaxID=62062 RepID=A0A4W5K7I7_9TELE